MLGLLLRRLATLVPTLLGVTLAAFALIRLVPGDPVEVMVGERQLDPAAHAALVQRLGLDQPLAVQYGRYVAQLAQGDLGQSLVTREPVSAEFAVLFPATIELAAAAFTLALVLGMTLGLVAALKRGSWVDQSVMALATLGHSMPVFWWGLILIMAFSVGLEWTPVSGRVGIEYDIDPVTGFMLVDAALASARGQEPGAFTSALLHLALPATVLGTVPMAVIARMTRSSMLEVLREDYMRTARAKGLAERLVVWRHGLRNVLLPILTVLGVILGGLITGTFVVETLFNIPGLGRIAIQSIFARDYPVTMGIVMLFTLLYAAISFAVDVLYGVIDPRVRVGGGR